MYQQRWIYLTIAAVIGTLILLMVYQTLTQAVFPWDLLALVAAVSLAYLALMVLGKTAFTRHDLKDGRSIANRVAAGMVIFHNLGMVGILAYDLWFQDEMRWPFYIGYGLPLYVIGFFTHAWDVSCKCACPVGLHLYPYREGHEDISDPQLSFYLFVPFMCFVVK